MLFPNSIRVMITMTSDTCGKNPPNVNFAVRALAARPLVTIPTFCAGPNAGPLCSHNRRPYVMVVLARQNNHYAVMARRHVSGLDVRVGTTVTGPSPIMAKLVLFFSNVLLDSTIHDYHQIGPNTNISFIVCMNFSFFRMFLQDCEADLSFP